MEPLLDFLKATDADIMLLQEVHSGVLGLEPRLRTMQYFHEQLSYPFSAFYPHYRDFDNTPDGSSYSGDAVFSRWPIVETRAVYYDLDYTETYRDSFENAPLCPGSLGHAVIKTPAGSINIYNLHGPVDNDGERFNEARRKMSDAIIAETTDKGRLILAGDTNARPANEAIRRISHLNNVFGDELTSTFNMKRKTLPGYATAAVDMMFVSPDVKVIKKQCPAVEVSDHLPLVVEVEITD